MHDYARPGIIATNYAHTRRMSRILFRFLGPAKNHPLMTAGLTDREIARSSTFALRGVSAAAISHYPRVMNFFAKAPNNLGMILLAVWLILFGVLTAPFLKLNFAHSGDLLAVLAIVVGVLFLIKR